MRGTQHSSSVISIEKHIAERQYHDVIHEYGRAAIFLNLSSVNCYLPKIVAKMPKRSIDSIRKKTII